MIAPLDLHDNNDSGFSSMLPELAEVCPTLFSAEESAHFETEISMDPVAGSVPGSPSPSFPRTGTDTLSPNVLSPSSASSPLPALDAHGEAATSGLQFDDVPADIAAADIYIAPDGTFIETSSGAAARWLKKRYDQYLGVGKDVRSPYAITAFINQHGKEMFRVGARDLSAPAAAAEEIERRTNGHEASTHPPHHPPHVFSAQVRRRSRMSVHSFLPSAVFKSTGMPAIVPVALDGSRSPPLRKLRKTRSIPNIGGGSDVSPHVAHRTSTGRPHAHSVSSADIFSPPMSTPNSKAVEPGRDIFADVMLWPTLSASPSTSSSVLPPSSGVQSAGNGSTSEQNGAEEQHIIMHPFGLGVCFDSPSWRATPRSDSSPTLREMQSFESGLTARADQRSTPAGDGTPWIADRPDKPDRQPPNTDALPSTSFIPHLGAHRASAPSEETSMHSRYSTEVFEVLQTSRGLPVLERLSPTSHQTTIKLSLKSDDSAAPRDDPRFVIWGEVEPDETDEPTRTSTRCLPSRQSRKNGISRATFAMSRSESSSDQATEGPTRMLVAATIERWIAQLTSDLNYDELLAFFLTYRTYVSALDLGHLLICRFHWALGEPKNARDEMIRRIVRVRTFTAMRYWAVTFFDADFVPNRELRILSANWLNSLRRDPILQRHKDAFKIVRQLRKVFLECKDAHLRRNTKQAGQVRNADRTGNRVPAVDSSSHAHSLDMTGRSSEGNADDSDIDLDFDDGYGGTEHSLSVNAPSSSRNTSGPLDLAMLRQPLHLTFLQYGKKSSISALSAEVPPPILLPVPHSTLSRVLVNTIGRLGRWKRVLNPRSPGRAVMNPCVDVSAFDVEASETGDLLLVRGGVEQYLRMVENQFSQATLVDGHHSLGFPSVATHTQADSNPPNDSQLQLDSNVRADPDEELQHPDEDSAPVSTLPSRPISTSTLFADNIDISTTPAPNNESSLLKQQLDVISIDEMDLSDLSSEEDAGLASPPGLRKLPRRLPTRRDFEFVRHSVDSVSSMGIRSRESFMSTGSTTSVGPDVGTAIQQWQMNALVESLSDDEGTGDVEAALRRLEGQISEEHQRAKQSKVDRWVRAIRQRGAAGRASPYPSDHSSDEDYGELRHSSQFGAPEDGTYQFTDTSSLSESNGADVPVCSMEYVEVESAAALAQEAADNVHSPVASPGSASPVTDTRPAVEDAVPLEILQSRVDCGPLPNSNANNMPRPIAVSDTSSLAHILLPENVKRHYSFVLNYRAETLIQHFCMIDRELFLNIRFEELVSPHFVGPAHDTNVLDWAHFLRERARLKAEGRVGYQTASLTVVRGRFNLIANFVLSEIVLTHPSERIRVITKFIRLAWKAYELKNFNMLVALVAGLRSHWVQKAMRQSPDRLRVNDQRILNDLTSWTSKTGHFMYIRQTVEALAEAKPIEVRSRDASVASTDRQPARSRAVPENKPSSPPACVPFFGVYLSQLQLYTHLPDLIDPTAPHEPVGIDPITNTFDAPAHPEVFSTLAPLPPSMQLEPLINVHKQRLIASVVKSFVAAQHLASRVQYPLEKKLFQKCLKLRGLDTDTLERALALYADMK